MYLWLKKMSLREAMSFGAHIADICSSGSSNNEPCSVVQRIHDSDEEIVDST
jgi:hypothetical protein